MKKLVSCIIVVAVLVAVVAGGIAILKNRGNVPGVKGELPAVQPTADINDLVAQAVAEALAAQQPTAMPTVEPTAVPTAAEAEVIDIDALVAAAVAEALAAQQPTAEPTVVPTAEAVNCAPCNCAEEVEVKAEEVVAEAETFKVGEKYTAVVNMPIFTGVTYDGSGVIYTSEPEMAVSQKNTAVYGKPAQPQFALNGDLVGYRMLGYIPEAYQLQEMVYEYVMESTMTIQELIESVTVRNDNNGFSLRAESNKGQKPVAKLWLSEKESEYWTICMRADGTFVVLMRTQAATFAPRKAVVVVENGGGGGEHHEEHHEPGPGPEPKGPEPDPQYDPIILPWDDDQSPAPAEPNPQYDNVELPWD